MKKQYRIKKTEEFQKIIKKHPYSANKEYVVYYRNKQEQTSRFGISVGKKLGNAVLRNKVKRQVRNILSESIKDNDYKNDYIIIVRNKFLKNDFKTNKKSLLYLLNKIEREI